MDTSREPPLSVLLALGPLLWKLVTLFLWAAAAMNPVLPVPVPVPMPLAAAAAILELPALTQ